MSKKEQNNLNINKYYVNMIIQFLENRKIVYNVKNINYSCRVSDGIPQGSTLSALLFNIYTIQLHRQNSDDCKLIQYADDITLVIKAKSSPELMSKAKQEVETLIRNLAKINLKLNLDKCGSLVCFHNEMDNTIFDFDICGKKIKTKII